MASQVFISLNEVRKQFSAADRPVLECVTANIYGGRITGLVGPDGAGKTTLMRLMAGLLEPTQGRIKVAGYDTVGQVSSVHTIVSYMPQRFGLYEDLTVMENLHLYADLRGVVGKHRQETFERLLAFTGLRPFTSRLAGKLSGGMKQKLGLACALIHRPLVLLLDEPSVGVDPVSRRELWKMVNELVDEGTAVIWSTAYMDEAQRCDEVLLLNEGKLLYQGKPEDLIRQVEGQTFIVETTEDSRRQLLAKALEQPDILDAVIQGRKVRLILKTPTAVPPALGTNVQARPTSPRFEYAFMVLLSGIPKTRISNVTSHIFQKLHEAGTATRDVVVEARDLTKRFGSFTAVDQVSFTVRRGEIFGLLGPNGAGKSTIFKMMCGLLRPTSGKAEVAGVDLTMAPAKARERLGYMAQRFSLYSDLSVHQNLEFFGGVYGLKGRRLQKTIHRMIEEFELAPFINSNAGDLPLGFKQRLAMACAIMHEPQVLFLDEPTSGVDPITRREFWIRINAMVDQGMTIIVTTHFLDEAEYCDRIAMIYQGRIIATGTPDDLKRSIQSENLPEPTLEDAFIEMIQRHERYELEVA